MIEHVVKRDGRLVPFNRAKIAFAVYRAAVAVGGRARAPAELVTDDVVALLERRAAAARARGARIAATAGATSGPAAHSAPAAAAAAPTVEEVQDVVEKVLIERGHARTAKAYIIYRYEHALKREGQPSATYSLDNVPYQCLWQTLAWAADRRCTRLADLAAAMEAGRFPALIAAAEQFYASQISAAVDTIVRRDPAPRVIIVAGPSASGKTTTTIKLREQLERLGMRLFALGVDHYFYDLELHPRDPRGDYDFETPQALNLELLNRDLTHILAGEEVRIPRYDFTTGTQHPAAQPVRIDSDTVLLIDSLHGLYPALTAAVPRELKVGIYVETLSQVKDDTGAWLRWSDVRMLRRMVRDQQFRNYTARQTLLHWQYVRRAEMRHIIPRLRLADAIVNTYLAYELPLLKGRLGPEVRRLAAELRADASGDSDDARARVIRLAALLDGVAEWPHEDAVPRDSLLREFIGGSSYHYE